MSNQVRVQVFVDEKGHFGSPLLIVTECESLPDQECARIARTSGTSETIFIDNADLGRVRIFVPTGRVPFAGYPLIGAGWFLRDQGLPVSTLTTDAGPVRAEPDSHGCAIVTSPGRGMSWELIAMSSPEDVLTASADGPERHDYAWAWEHEPAGRVRARAFTSASGVVEDEATGSAAIELCAHLRRELTITQGAGSPIHVKPIDEGVRLSGLVIRA